MTAVLSLEVYQQHRADAAYRAQVHAAVDVLLDELEAQWPIRAQGCFVVYADRSGACGTKPAERHDCASVWERT